MPVSIRNLSPTGVRQPTIFSDDFTATLPNLRLNYLMVSSNTNTLSKNGAADLQVNAGALGATNFVCMIPFNIAAARNRDQFAQFTWSAQVNGIEAGAALMVSNDGQQIQTAGGPGVNQLYEFGLASAGNGGFSIRKVTNSVITTLLALGAATYALGDVVRCEARIAAGGGSITLEAFKNGVSVGSVVDAAAPVHITGMPGMLHRSASVAGALFRWGPVFSCGRL